MGSAVSPQEIPVARGSGQLGSWSGRLGTSDGWCPWLTPCGYSEMFLGNWKHRWNRWTTRNLNPNYPLVMTNSLRTWSWPIEIVDLPIKNGGSFHSYVNVYQRVTQIFGFLFMDISSFFWHTDGEITTDAKLAYFASQFPMDTPTRWE